MLRDDRNEENDAVLACSQRDLSMRWAGPATVDSLIPRSSPATRGNAVVGVVEALGGGVQPRSEDQPNGKRQPQGSARSRVP